MKHKKCIVKQKLKINYLEWNTEEQRMNTQNILTKFNVFLKFLHA